MNATITVITVVILLAGLAALGIYMIRLGDLDDNKRKGEEREHARKMYEMGFVEVAIPVHRSDSYGDLSQGYEMVWRPAADAHLYTSLAPPVLTDEVEDEDDGPHYDPQQCVDTAVEHRLAATEVKVEEKF